MSWYSKIYNNRRVLFYLLACCLIIAAIFCQFQKTVYEVSIPVSIKPGYSNKNIVNASYNKEKQLDFFTARDNIASVIRDKGINVDMYVGDELSGEKIYDDERPIKIKILDKSFGNKKLTVTNITSSSYCLMDGNLNRKYLFGYPVLASNITWILYPNKSYSGEQKVVSVDIANKDSLAGLYAEKLKIYFTNKDSTSAILKIRTDQDLDKAADLLTGIVDLYNQKKSKSLITTAIVPKQFNEVKWKTNVYPDKKVLKKQIEILNELRPYLKSDNRQFSLMPNTFDLKNADLQQLINQFNEHEIRMQQLLTDNEPDSGEIKQMDLQLNQIKLNVASNIDHSINYLNHLNKGADSAKLQSKHASNVSGIVSNNLSGPKITSSQKNMNIGNEASVSIVAVKENFPFIFAIAIFVALAIDMIYILFMKKRLFRLYRKMHFD